MPAALVARHKAVAVTLAVRRQHTASLPGNDTKAPQPQTEKPTTNNHTQSSKIIKLQTKKPTTTNHTQPSKVVKPQHHAPTRRIKLNVTDKDWKLEVAHRHNQARTQQHIEPDIVKTEDGGHMTLPRDGSLPDDIFQDSVTSEIKKIFLVINRANKTIRPRYVFRTPAEAAEKVPIKEEEDS